MSSRRRSLTLESRLVAASAVLAAVVGGAFLLLILALSAHREATREQAESHEVIVEALTLQTLVLDMETGLRGYVRTGRLSFLEPYAASRRQLQPRLTRFDDLANEPAQRRRAQQLITAIELYQSEYSEPVRTFATRERTPASLAAGRDATNAEGRRRIEEIRGRFDEFIRAENALGAERTRSAESQSDLAIGLSVLGFVACGLFIVLFALYLARSIARPVREAAAGATQLASGDLSLRLHEGGPGEVGELTRAFNEMAERLESALHELAEQNAQLRESDRMKSSS